MRSCLIILALLLPAGCSDLSQEQAQRGPAIAGPDQLPPSQRGTDIPEAVDGLIVGHRAMAAGEFEIALRAYTRAAVTHGPSVDVLSAIGSANLRLGRLGQAEQDLRRALEQDGTFVAAHNNLGVALAEQGKWGEAELHFRNAFTYDAGRSAEIRENLLLAIENRNKTRYHEIEAYQLLLMRRGSGRFLLLSTPL